MSNHTKTALFFISVFLLLAVCSQFSAIGFGYYAIVGLSWIAVVFIGSSFIGSNYHVRTYCSNPSETEKKIALTFDDGPSPITLQVLDILEKHEAKAAFFCIGKNIEKYPEIFKKIIEKGHLVGNHSYHHSPFFDFQRKQAVVEELQMTNTAIERYSGKKAALFRPPYGVTNPSIRKALAVTKHKAIGWNIRSLDGIIKNEDFIFNRTVKRISPGGIVLLHDTSQQSADVLERLLAVLRKKNYNVVSLEELLNIKAYED